MRSRHNALIMLLFAACAGCGAAAGPPTSRVASTEAAIRSARELGAESVPAAALHLRFSQEQLENAKAAMVVDENERADLLLRRAQADAELAIGLTRELTATTGNQQAAEKLQQAKAAK